MIASALICLAAVRSAPPKPHFPVSWVATETSSIDIAQGSVKGPNGESCCAPNSPKCQVQTQSQSGTHYWDGVGNQTRFESPGQIVVTQYAIAKEMLVSSNGTCESFCPTDGGFDSSPFWPSAGDHETVRDLGKTKVNGVEVQHFSWVEHILGIIKMQLTDMYIVLPADPSAEATPVWEHDIIEPFGNPVGTEDTHWANFKPGQPDAQFFKVSGIAECPEDPNCGNSNMVWAARRLRDKDFVTYAKYAQGQH